MARHNFVWQLTDQEAYNRLTAAASAPYLSHAQRLRIERIRQARMLYRGQHEQYFIREKRSTFPTLTLKVNGVERQIYVPINVLGLISKKSADLLFGEAPRIRCDSQPIQTAIDELIARTNLPQVLYRSAIQASWSAEAFIDVARVAGRVYITDVASDEIHPEGEIGPDGQYASYLRTATRNVGTEDSPIILLLETRHRVGSVERKLWQLDKDGGKQLELSLDQWPEFAAAAPKPIEQTGLDVCTIVFVANELLEGRPLSDYDELIPLQDATNSRNSQLARVHAVHANPKMYFATGSADEDGNVRATDEAFFGDSPEAMPKYIEMLGKPDAAAADRDFVLEMLLVTSETSPALLGMKKGAVAESARKLRLELLNSLAKAGRKSAYFKPAIARAVTIALRLQGLSFSESIDVEMRDGLPNDPIEVAEQIATLTGAGAISKYRSLEMQNLDPEAIEAELARIQEDAANSMPSSLLGEPDRDVDPEAGTDSPDDPTA